MSAVRALGAARAFGVHLELDGDDLLLEAVGPPPDAVLAALSRHKPEVVRLLNSAQDGSSPEYWHVLFHQRGGRLVELRRDWAVIERASDRSRHVHHRQRPKAADIVLPWIGLR
jgi:hypothetical protein